MSFFFFFFFFFFFNDTATTEIYTLSLHDALPIRAGRHRSPDPSGARLRQPGSRPHGTTYRLGWCHCQRPSGSPSTRPSQRVAPPSRVQDLEASAHDRDLEELIAF